MPGVSACTTWLLVIAGIGACSPQVEEIPLLDRSVFFGATEAAGGVLSPDGRFLAYAKPHRGRLNLWLRPLFENGGADRALTASAEQNIGDFAFSADGQHIVFLRDTDGDEKDHLFSINVSASRPTPVDLTPLADIKALLIALPDQDPEHALVGLNDRDERFHDVYRIALADGARTLVRQNDAGYSRWWTDRQDRLALGLRIEDDGASSIFDVSVEPPRVVFRCEYTETCIPLQFHTRKRRFYMISNHGDEDLTRLLLVDPEYGSVEPVHRDPKREVDVGNTIFSRQTGRLLAVSYLGDRQRIYGLDTRFVRDINLVRDALPDADPVFRSPTLDDRFWIIKEVIDIDEGSNFLYDRVRTTVIPLYESFPAIPREATARRRSVRYPARDGREIPAYLTPPRGWRAQGTLPVVVIVHGGPWQRDTWGWDAEAQFLANRGYLVLQPNFRGSTGFGKDYLNAGDGQWGTGVMQTDIEDGVRWLIDKGWADPGRIAIKGVSYGGYAALAGLAFTPDLFAAGVAVAAPTDLGRLLETLPGYWQPQRELLYRRIGHPVKDADRLRAASPLYAAQHIRAALLIMQGANDPRVPRAQADRMAIAVHAAGAEVRYLLSQGQGHAFTGHSRLLSMAVMEDFLARHLGGRAQAPGPELSRQIEALQVDVAGIRGQAGYNGDIE